MASFTDSISTYNPYISELPVDLMTKVGMEKQQQYEQGIQKIQSTIDNVAGLDIYRDNDKQYLQSKLNQLGDDLKWVGASDFSDFQLVNSVNGMTNQLVKDPNILNAVSSTARVRKGFSDMEAAKKAGKSSASNEYVFGLEVNEYANNKDLKASYNGGYEQVVDITNPLNEAFKNAHIDKFEGDEAVRNADGSINPDLLNHRISEGLSSPKVKEIAMSVFKDPKISRQLQIDSIYKYKDYDTNSLINEKALQISQQVNNINQQNLKLLTYASLASGDTKIQATKTFKENQLTLDTLNENFSKFKELATSNLSEAKYQVFLDSKLQDAVTQFAGINESNKQEVAPSFTVQNAKDHLHLEQASLQERMRMDNASIENMHSQQLERAFNMQLAEKKANGELNPDGSKPFLTYTPPVDSKETQSLGSSSMYKTIEETEKSRNQLFAKFTNGIGIVVPGQTTPVQDFYVPGKNGEEFIINPKYLNKDPNNHVLLNDEGAKLYNLAKTQLKKIADNTGKLHTDSKVSKEWAPDIQQWYDQGTYLQAAKKKIEEVESQYKPILDKIQKKAELKDSYNLAVTTLGSKGGDIYHVNLSKQQLVDIALYEEGRHSTGEDSDSSKQAYSKLEKIYGNKTGEIIEAVKSGKEPWGENNIIIDKFKILKTALNLSSNKNALIKRENDFKTMQMQSQGNELKYNAPSKESFERMRTDMAALYANIMQGKSSGGYKQALSLLEKKKGGDVDNDLFKFRYDDKSGKWFGKVTSFAGGEENIEAPEVEVSKGFIDNYHLNKMIDPKMIILNNSAIGKTLNMNQGRGTVNNVNDIGAYNSAFNRSKIGKYSLGFHIKAMNPLDPDSPSFIYLYTRDNKGMTYPPIQLDYEHLSRLPGMPSYISEDLKSKSNAIDKTQILETISNLQTTLNKFKDPDAAIKLLLNNSDKK